MGDGGVVAVLERAEAGAYEDMYACAPPELGATARRVAGALVISCPSLPVVTFNRALGIDTPPDDELLDIAGTIQLAPGLETDAVRARLREDVHWAKVIRDAGAPADVATELEVRELGPEAGEAFGRVVTTAFGMPPTAVPWLTPLVGRVGRRISGGQRRRGAARRRRLADLRRLRRRRPGQRRGPAPRRRGRVAGHRRDAPAGPWPRRPA